MGGSLHEWAPALLAGGAAAVVAYAAYSSARNAVKEYEAAAAIESANASVPQPPQRSRRGTADEGTAPSSSRHARFSGGDRAEASGSSPTTARQPEGPEPSSGNISSGSSSKRSGTGHYSPPAPEPLGSPTSSSSAARECIHCHKEPEDATQLQRCSRCKQVWYCSQSCQRQAWPKHKAVCNKNKASAATAPVAAEASSGQAPAAAASPAGPTTPTPSQEGSGGDAMLGALRGLLQQHAGAQDDPLQRSFEQGVLAFIQGNFPAAISSLEGVQSQALKTGQAGIAGDACRWLGHAHGKAGDAAKAAAAFAQGCQLGKEHNNKRLQVECLSGLGSLQRQEGQLEVARGFLSEALAVAEELGDSTLRASALCQLGTVLIATDVDTAVKHLQLSVDLRDEQVIAMNNAGERNGLATAIFEHAGSMVALAGALYCAQRYTDAAYAYCKALEVFKLVEDVDKMVKCLVNLSNIYELQIPGPASREHAASYRRQLYQLAAEQLNRHAPTSCSICQQALHPLAATSGDAQSRLLLLACLHCFHHHCWMEQQEEGQGMCPSCKEPTPAINL